MDPPRSLNVSLSTHLFAFHDLDEAIFPFFPRYGFSLAEIWAMPPHFPTGDLPAADAVRAADGDARHPGCEHSRPPVSGRSDLQEGPVVLPLLRGRGAPARVRRRDRPSRRLARAQRRGNGGPAHLVPGRTVVSAPLGCLSLLDERTPRRGPRRRPVRGREHPGRLRRGERHPRHRGPVPGGPGGRLPGPRSCPHRGERAFRRARGGPPPDPRARLGQPRGKGRTPRAGKRRRSPGTA